MRRALSDRDIRECVGVLKRGGLQLGLPSRLFTKFLISDSCAAGVSWRDQQRFGAVDGQIGGQGFEFQTGGALGGINFRVVRQFDFLPVDCE